MKRNENQPTALQESFFQTTTTTDATRKEAPVMKEATRKDLVQAIARESLTAQPDIIKIEALLYTLVPGTDHSDKAADLLKRFGSFPAVMNAEPEALAAIVGKTTAEKIRIFRNVSREYITDARKTEQILNRTELESYCRRLLNGETIEKFYVIAVNCQCRVTGYRLISTGSLSEVSAYPREVIRAALDLNAHAVFFTHNHPGGTCAPSAEDIQSTIQLQRLLNSCGIMVLDHCIVAGNATYSMSQHGDLDFKSRTR